MVVILTLSKYQRIIAFFFVFVLHVDENNSEYISFIIFMKKKKKRGKVVEGLYYK
jgi:hypothetical protein